MDSSKMFHSSRKMHLEATDSCISITYTSSNVIRDQFNICFIKCTYIEYYFVKMIIIVCAYISINCIGDSNDSPIHVLIK